MAFPDDRRHMVGERLAELREQKALTLRDLEEVSGVGADAISKIENGHRKPRPSTLRKLARALGVEVEDFFREPAVPLAKAPREAGRTSADVEEAEGFIEGVAAAADSAADRIEKRSEQTSATDGDALTALLEDAWLTHRGARQLLAEFEEEAAQKQRETPAERRARSKLERAVMRLNDLAEATLSGLLEGPEELEWAEERAEQLIRLDEERLRRRAG
jgi:transcriptional regulator with XRE-family HTH domain